MKEYPSISRAFREIPNAYIFDKLDGSSMRSEWNRKRSWYKHGRRHGLLDDSNTALTAVPVMFGKLFAEPLARVATNNRWDHLIIFYEFWGTKSLAGLHSSDDEKHLTLFDAAVDKKGILGPRDFRKLFENNVETAAFLGIHNYTRGFVESVRLGQVEGITFEGVVAKAGEGHHLVYAKAKTQQWIDKVLQIYGAKQGQQLVDS